MSKSNDKATLRKLFLNAKKTYPNFNLRKPYGLLKDSIDDEIDIGVEKGYLGTSDYLLFYSAGNTKSFDNVTITFLKNYYIINLGYSYYKKSSYNTRFKEWLYVYNMSESVK